MAGRQFSAGVKSLIVTHSHQDHFYPLELIMRALPYSHSPEGILTVYGNSNVKRLYEIALAEEDDSQNLHDMVHYQLIDWFSEFVTEDGYLVTALPANHKLNERCCTYLIEKDCFTEMIPASIRKIPGPFLRAKSLI